MTLAIRIGPFQFVFDDNVLPGVVCYGCGPANLIIARSFTDALIAIAAHAQN